MMAEGVGRFADLAERVRTGAPRLGTVRFVAVDGPAGAGKTTFARRLSAALRATAPDPTQPARAGARRGGAAGGVGTVDAAGGHALHGGRHGGRGGSRRGRGSGRRPRSGGRVGRRGLRSERTIRRVTTEENAPARRRIVLTGI